MKIAIVVQGRFHAFDLGSALLRRGHDVALFTNYPKWTVRRFGFPAARVRSFWFHGALSRGAYRWKSRSGPERWLNPMFGRWAARELSREHWDVIHGWSGVSEEIFTTPSSRASLNLLMRGSAHIRTQDSILKDEEERTAARLDRPDEWIKLREQREYKLADRVVLLSTFARDTFVAQGVDPAKLRLLPLGANTGMFRPKPEIVEARCHRILSGEPLRVLYVGSLSLQKGLWDARAIASRVGRERFRFRFVGPITREAKNTAQALSRLAEIVPKQPQRELPAWYADSDVFLFPTLQDGFAVVLAQAQASALPILTTVNCSGPDLIRDRDAGWILPIRDPDAFIERLHWCDANRPGLADMVRRLYTNYRVRNWDDVAEDFEAMCRRELASAPSVNESANGRR
jgi:glycosyltransferase involved in cell wall biosynthesis